MIKINVLLNKLKRFAACALFAGMAFGAWAANVATVTVGSTTTEYETFASALEAWDNGSTLTLYKDVETSSTINVPSGSTRTLDLNGYGINGNKEVITVIVVNGNLTLKDSNPGSTHKFTVSNVASNGAGLATVNDALTGTEGTNYKTFTGGYITGGTSVGENCGGGIRVVSGATLNMKGGTIIGNGTVINYDAGMRGSGVMVQGTFNMSGGSIIYNYAYNEGGGVDVLSSSANMTMSGGKISYNYAHMEAGGVHGWDKPTFTMSGGEITSNYSEGNSGGVDTGGNYYGTMKLSGSPVIKDNIAGTLAQNLYIKNGGSIQIIGELTDEAAVYVTIRSPGVFTNSTNTTFNDASKFFSDDANYTVLKNSDGQLKVSVPPVATVTTSAGVTTDYGTFAAALSAWVDGSTLTLYKDVEIASTINVTKNQTLDLNGCGLKYTANDYMAIMVDGGGNLTLKDSNTTTTHYFSVSSGFATNINDASGSNSFKGGYITGGKTHSYNGYYHTEGGAILIKNGNCTMESGTLIGNASNAQAVGVYSGTFTLNGGTISYNGAGVHLRSGSAQYPFPGTSGGTVANFVMNGGEISYNKGNGVTSGYWCYGGGNLTLKGGSIIHNGGYGAYSRNTVINGNPVIKDNAGGGLTLYEQMSISGAPVITDNTGFNLKVGNNQAFSIVGELEEGTQIGMTMSTPGVFTNSTNTAYNDLSKFFSDDNSCLLLKNAEGQLALGEAVAMVTTRSGVSTKYATLEEAVAEWVDGSILTLYKDASITTSIIPPSGTSTLDLNGRTITMAAQNQNIIRVTDGKTFKLKDSVGTGKITGAKFTGGYSYGAGVYASGENTVFEMHGGSITGNELTNSVSGGGGVETEGNAVFKMYGGKITNNKAAYGGAIYLRGTKGYIYDGELSGNTAHSTCGGAVHAFGNTAQLIMEGGVIKNNTAPCGGGVNPNGEAKIIISGGQIINNTATTFGGGVTNRRANASDAANATIIITGNPVIKDNTCNGNVSNVHIYKTEQCRFEVGDSHLTAGAYVGVYVDGWDPSTSDTKVVNNASINDLKYFVSDNTSGSDFIFDDGTDNWYYNKDTETFIKIVSALHSPEAKTIWLSSKATPAAINTMLAEGWEITSQGNTITAKNIASNKTYTLTFDSLKGNVFENKVKKFALDTGLPVSSTGITIPAVPGLYDCTAPVTVLGTAYELTLPRKLLVISETADNTDYITAAASEEAVDVAVTRSFGLNYGTLCLPFALTADEIKASGIRKVYEVTGATSNEVKFNTKSKKVSSTVAGKPYMIHFNVASSWNMQIFENKKVVAAPVDTSVTGVKFKGTFAPTQLPAGDKTKLFIQQGGTGFTYPKAGDTTSLPAFRAWFEKDE